MGTSHIRTDSSVDHGQVMVSSAVTPCPLALITAAVVVAADAHVSGAFEQMFASYRQSSAARQLAGYL